MVGSYQQLHVLAFIRNNLMQKLQWQMSMTTWFSICMQTLPNLHNSHVPNRIKQNQISAVSTCTFST